MRLPIDTVAVQLMSAGPPEAVLDFEMAVPSELHSVLEIAAYSCISDLRGRDGSLPDTPGTNGLTSNSPPQYVQAWKPCGTGIDAFPVSDFTEIVNSSALMHFDATSFPKTQKDATPSGKSRTEGIR
jgi:hypothetical protein